MGLLFLIFPLYQFVYALLSLHAATKRKERRQNLCGKKRKNTPPQACVLRLVHTLCLTLCVVRMACLGACRAGSGLLRARPPPAVVFRRLAARSLSSSSARVWLSTTCLSQWMPLPRCSIQHKSASAGTE